MRLSDALRRVESPPAAGAWLAIGRVAGRAIRRAGLPANTPVRLVHDVHRALEVLETLDVAACVVDATCLTERPAAALQMLNTKVGASRVFVVAKGKSRRLERATRHLGVQLCRIPSEQAREAGTTPEADPVLPRADLSFEARLPVDAAEGPFAAGCLAHMGKLPDLIRYTAETLRTSSGATRVSVMLVDDARRTLCIRHADGLDPDLVDALRAPLGRGIAGRAASLGRPVAGYGEQGGQRDYGGAAYVVLPLVASDDVLGVVNLTGLPDDRLPEEEILASWARVAGLAGLAIGTARRLERAEALMTTDVLTQLPNRRAFERALIREVDRAARSGDGLAVAVFDADDFKSVNDLFGHQAGDRVLAGMAATLKQAFRESDLVARWGGEEFAVLLPGQRGERPEASLRALERARRNVAGRPVPLGPGLPSHRVTVSCGVSFYPHDGHDGTTLVRAADEALLAAKTAGKNTIRRA